MATIDDQGERMVPEIHSGTLLYSEHYTRYLAAVPLVTGKRVLDIASGSGYGTHLLSETAAHVVGVDASAEAVAYATEVYGTTNNEFVTGDATAIPLADSSVDVVVSFETIEHIEDYRAFMAEIDRVLADDGILLLSTPNDLEFIEDNHFHLHEFTHDELLDLVRPLFPHIERYYQATWQSVLLSPESMITEEGPITPSVLNLCPVPPERFLYFYFVCSRSPVTGVDVAPVLALGGHHSDRLARQVDVNHAAALDRAEVARHHADEARHDAEQALAQLLATRSVRLARGMSRLAGSLGWGTRR